MRREPELLDLFRVQRKAATWVCVPRHGRIRVRFFYLSQPRRRVVKSDSRAKIRAKAKPGRAEALRPFGGGPT